MKFLAVLSMLLISLPSIANCTGRRLTAKGTQDIQCVKSHLADPKSAIIDDYIGGIIGDQTVIFCIPTKIYAKVQSSCFQKKQTHQGSSGRSYDFGNTLNAL